MSRVNKGSPNIGSSQFEGSSDWNSPNYESPNLNSSYGSPNMPSNLNNYGSPYVSSNNYRSPNKSKNNGSTNLQYGSPNLNYGSPNKSRNNGSPNMNHESSNLNYESPNLNYESPNLNVNRNGSPNFNSNGYPNLNSNNYGSPNKRGSGTPNLSPSFGSPSRGSISPNHRGSPNLRSSPKPRGSPNPESLNPYENVKRQSMMEQQRRDLYHGGGSGPKIIIDDDPVIPDYPMQDTLKKYSNYNMKIVVVGDGGCGKTCLLVSYAQRKFPEIYVPTVFENYVTNVITPNGKIIELALWDTAGQEEYDRLRPLSYPDVDILLVCFSLDNLVSLQNVKDSWFPEVSHFCPGIPILLVGTKADLYADFDPDLPIQLASEINAIGYIQCSAKTMFNIKTVFNFALNHYQKQMEMQEQVEKSSKSKRLSKVLGLSHGSFGSHGHTRNQSSVSNKRGHLKNTSYDSSVLLDEPLTEDTYSPNPYTSNPYNNFTSKYNEDEFAFTRKEKKKRKCVIL